MNVKGMAVVAAVLAAASPLPARELTRHVSDATTITEPDTGVGRVLFRADLSVEDENVSVRRAYVRVPMTAVELSEPMTLRIHPVTSEWDAGAVSWTSWSEPGGDFESEVHGRAEVSARAEGEIVFDITILAKDILEHGVPNRGFLLTIDPGEGVGIPPGDVDAWDLQGASVEVQYRRTPPPPRRIG
jgi:hypothetical protein